MIVAKPKLLVVCMMIVFVFFALMSISPCVMAQEEGAEEEEELLQARPNPMCSLASKACEAKSALMGTKAVADDGEHGDGKIAVGMPAGNTIAVTAEAQGVQNIGALSSTVPDTDEVMVDAGEMNM